MLFNYLKLATRLLLRNPFFTFINIAGLSVGFAVFFVLWHHSTFELESDRFHKDHNRIYRAYCDFRFAEGEYWNNYIFSTIPPILAKLFAEKHTDVESMTRIIHQKNFDAVRWEGPQTDTAGFSQLETEITLSYIDNRSEKTSFKEKRCAFGDPNLFNFFSIPLIQGEPSRVLSQPDAVVLSQSTASRYFGQSDPLGKILILNDKESFTVTGVFKDLGNNTHIDVDLFFSTLLISNAIERVDPYQETAVSYFRFSKDADIRKAEEILTEETKLLWNFDEAFPGSSGKMYLQPLREAAFKIFENDAHSPKSKLKLQIFLAVAIVVLIMAWINYLNLKLSTQASRMKELATRKTAGARVGDFIKQFFVEAVLINILSVLIAITVIQILRSPLQLYFQLNIPELNEVKMQTSVIFISAMVGGILISTLHPALGAWKLTVRSMLTFGKVFADGRSFTKVTSVVQFVIGIVLIVWLGAVFNQVNFVLKNTWGLDRNGVVVIELPVNGDSVGRIVDVDEFKSKILALEGVNDATISTTVGGDIVRNRIAFFPVGQYSAKGVPKSDGGVDDRFVPFYKLKILAGRNFRYDHPADRRSVIISREAAQSAGWEPEEAIGKKVIVEKYPWRPITTEAEVIGVIDDHRYSPLYLQTTLAGANRGTILTYGNYLFANNKPAKISIRLRPTKDVMQAVEALYKEIFPGSLFHWYALEDHMNAHYEAEQIARNQLTFFTLIAIGIACLGLVGVISNKAVSKTKEIGIRKVLGARLDQIGRILLLPTLTQIGTAVMIGIPLAYLLTQSYLQKFAERVNLEIWHFTLPILLLILLMVMSVAWVIMEAARRNPVDALKHE